MYFFAGGKLRLSMRKVPRKRGLCLKIGCFILVHESISYCFKTFTIGSLGNEFVAFVNAS